MVASSTLTDYLRRQADSYYSDLRATRARVVPRRARRRGNSTLQEFIVGDGVTEHTILVKTPSPNSRQRVRRSGPQRPRLFPKASPDLKGRFEYEAMAAIQRHVAVLNDSRFDAVRVFDLLPDQQALVMEKVSDRSLSRLLLKATSLSPYPLPWHFFGRVMRSAGGWLRRYHTLPALKHTQPRGMLRSAYVDSLDSVSMYLTEVHGYVTFEELGAELKSLAERALPEELPLGLGHGDYAPRNVLVAPSGTIRVIDTLSRWKTPIYEDIGHFLAMLKTSAPQVWSHGLAYPARQIAYLERQFLKGYFESQQIPYARIRLFECHALVERCAAAADRCRRTPPWKRKLNGLTARWRNGYLQAQVRQLIEDAHTACLESAPREVGGVQ